MNTAGHLLRFYPRLFFLFLIWSAQSSISRLYSSVLSYQVTHWFNARWGSGRYAPFVFAELLSLPVSFPHLCFHVLQGG